MALGVIAGGLVLLLWTGFVFASRSGEQRARGVVTQVSARDIGHADTITLRTEDGRELQLMRAEKGCVSAKLLHAGLEGIAGASAGMLEEHAQCLASQVLVRLRPLPLELEPERGFDQRIDVAAGEVQIGEDAAAVQTRSSEARGGVVDPGIGLLARSSCVVAVDDCLHSFAAP